ncbi:MAG: MFS transporter [Endomicrobium sp.]|jgi:sugar phosphate permease|nr:MFS transporter [Endomicrobium sp.]
MLLKFINWIKPMPDAKIQLTDEKEIAKKYRAWRIRMFLGMYIGYMFYYFTRKNISYVAPLFINELNLTKVSFGVLNSAMAIAYGVGKFLCGMIADKCNTRTFMAFGLIGSSIVNLFFGFLPSLPILVFFWGLNGGFQSMGFPPVAKALVYWFSQNERGTMWTLFGSARMCGVTLIGILASFFIAINHWRAVFYIPGIIGIITGIGMLFVLTDTPSSIGLPAIEVFRKDIPPLKKQGNLSRWQVLTKYVFCNKYIWFIAIASTFMYFIRFATLDWSAIFMVERGIHPKTAASLLVLTPLLGTLSGVSSGYICDKFFKSRCVPISIVCLSLLIGSLWGMYHFTNSQTPLWIVGLFLSLVGFFIEGPQCVALGVLLSRLTLQESAAAALGFSGMFQYLGTFLSGIGAALIIEKYGWHGIFVTCGIFCIIVMFFISLTWKAEIEKLKMIKNK